MTEPVTPRPAGRRSTTTLLVIAGVLVVILIVAVVWLLVSASGGAAPSPSPTATQTTRPTPTVSPAPATRIPTPSPSPTADAATCTVAELSVTLGESNGGAGSTDVPLVFRNTGSRSCQLEGYPGVSLVGDGNGTQLGAPAGEDTSAPVTVLQLKPGDSVQAAVRVSDAANYDTTCGSQKADGFRVYPPHSTEAVFVPTTAYAACTNASVILMQVRPVEAG